jgi:Na+/glutamate symporter
MPFWQRLVITVVAMLAVSFVVGLIWQALLGFALPSYVAGMIGGLTALPVWEFLRRVGPKRAKTEPLV